MVIAAIASPIWVLFTPLIPFRKKGEWTGMILNMAMPRKAKKQTVKRVFIGKASGAPFFKTLYVLFKVIGYCRMNNTPDNTKNANTYTKNGYRQPISAFVYISFFLGLKYGYEYSDQEYQTLQCPKNKVHLLVIKQSSIFNSF